MRSDIEVTVGGEPSDSRRGPMANVIRYITGAADETGFTGFGGFGGRDDLLSFGDADESGRAFRFERTDTSGTVAILFEHAANGIDPDTGGRAPMQVLSTVVAGSVDEGETAAFRDEWHGRVLRILDAPADSGPFTIADVE